MTQRDMLSIGRFLDGSRNVTECCVSSVYDAMYRVYFYAAADK